MSRFEKYYGPDFNALEKGDPEIASVLIADINKAKSKLGWVPTRGIEDMVADTLAAFS